MCFGSLVGFIKSTYSVHLRLIGKLVMDFLFVLIEHVSLSVTAEALQANIDCRNGVSLTQHFRFKGSSPPTVILSENNSRVWQTERRTNG